MKLHEAHGDADTALEHRRKLMEVLDGEEKLQLLLDTARVAETVLGDPYQAIDCLEGALRLRPDDRETTERLLGLYRQTKQGPKAAELLERWLALPDLPDAQRVRAHVELGLLYKDDLREVDGALEKAATHLNAALDLDWKQAEAFQALEGMLGERPGLEAAGGELRAHAGAAAQGRRHAQRARAPLPHARRALPEGAQGIPPRRWRRTAP